MFLQGKVNSARYIVQIFNPVLLPFLRQESDVSFQQEISLPQRAVATHRAFCGVE